jgi:trans-aconitate 2-methyltransferase
VLGRLELGGYEVVLDAGCGSGRVTQELLRRLPEGRVVALDASTSMLDEARRRLSPFREQVRFIHADLLDLNGELLDGDDPVDAVFSTATFHWISDHERLFSNIASVLKSGGQLVAQCGAEGNVERVVRAARSLGFDLVGRWNFASPAETARRLEGSGFGAVRVWSHPEPTGFRDRDGLIDFLENGCLGELLAGVGASERRDLADRVADAMDEPVIDYVRLNIVARRV